MNMQKMIAAAILVVALGGFAYWESSRGTSPTTAAAPSSMPATEATPAASSSPDASAASASVTPTTAASGTFKDGSYTGAISNSVYGPVQVSATVSGGKIASVSFLQYPNDQRESQEVSERSMPILKQEAISAQSSKVAAVSGATQTSEAFSESLQSAIEQAQG